MHRKGKRTRRQYNRQSNDQNHLNTQLSFRENVSKGASELDFRWIDVSDIYKTFYSETAEYACF